MKHTPLFQPELIITPALRKWPVNFSPSWIKDLELRVLRGNASLHVLVSISHQRDIILYREKQTPPWLLIVSVDNNY